MERNWDALLQQVPVLEALYDAIEARGDTLEFRILRASLPAFFRYGNSKAMKDRTERMLTPPRMIALYDTVREMRGFPSYEAISAIMHTFSCTAIERFTPQLFSADTDLDRAILSFARFVVTMRKRRNDDCFPNATYFNANLLQLVIEGSGFGDENEFTLAEVFELSDMMPYYAYV